MYNIGLRMMNRREEAEDMLQETFIEAFKRLNSFRYESSFGQWLKRIMINKCINGLRKRKAELVLEGEVKDNRIEETETDEDKLNVEKIHNAMTRLPEGYRVVFSLYLIEGYDHNEISEILGISVSTSKSQYMRAKRRIREILNTSNYEKRSTGTIYN